MRVLSFSETGSIRKNNEDRCLALPEYGLYAVADGMGGQLAGEVAAEMVLNQLSAAAYQLVDLDLKQREEWLIKTLKEANKNIYELACRDADKEGMGTTLTALVIQDNEAVIAHVGDSRAYLWRNGKLKPLTEDHSLVGELVRMGQITAEQADTHPQRHILVRAVGTAEEIRVDCFHCSVQAKDIFLLCTDGVSNTLSESEMAAELKGAESEEDLPERLKELIWERGAKDNFTALFCIVE